MSVELFGHLPGNESLTFADLAYQGSRLGTWDGEGTPTLKPILTSDLDGPSKNGHIGPRRKWGPRPNEPVHGTCSWCGARTRTRWAKGNVLGLRCGCHRRWWHRRRSAGPVVCKICRGYPAVYLVQSLDRGDTIGIDCGCLGKSTLTFFAEHAVPTTRCNACGTTVLHHRIVGAGPTRQRLGVECGCVSRWWNEHR